MLVLGLGLGLVLEVYELLEVLGDLIKKLVNKIISCTYSPAGQ